jgi:NAD-dependent SIR2 family protein deacetylase
MATAYFLGAGASASDGVPVTNELNYGIANFLLTERGKNGVLWRYYHTLYGITPDKLRPAQDCWRRFLDDRSCRPKDADHLPSIIETLSVLDLCIQEGRTLWAPRRKTPEDVELSADFLRSVRIELCMALGMTIKEAIHDQRSPCTNALAQRLEPSDTVVSANWDRLVERAVTYFYRKSSNLGSHLSSTNLRHGCVNERFVNRQGEDIHGRAENLLTVLKLHGSLNWFFCPCCGELYANVEGQWIVDPLARRPDYDECHCGAWLENLIVPPSFVKDYQNVHIRSTWRNAESALDRADRWVFIGYSLPPDDYHIRALLLRSGLINRNRRRDDVLKVTVVNYAEDHALEARYRDLLRFAEFDFRWDGFKNWLSETA